MRKIYILLLIMVSYCSAFAQQATIKGQVLDTIEMKKLQYSNVLLVRKADSIVVRSVRADVDGKFELNLLKKGSYSLVISYPKMADYVLDLELIGTSKIELGRINMELKSNLLREVEITVAKKAMSMKGDTLVFQADSFAVGEHANVQELLRRLPGIEVDINGKITAQGKAVNKVLVDGDEFFGDDPLMATKYLKAKGISEVQVYDKKSKEADFTGIDDGVRDKTINLKLKENAKNGYLSDFDLKSDLSKYNDVGALAAVYVRKLKVAVFGNRTNLNLTNNINQSLAGFSGAYDTYYKINSKDSGIPGAGDNIYNNVTGSGLPNNLKLGGYFSDKWNDNKDLASLNYNYFDNRSRNLQTSRIQELLPGGAVFTSSAQNSNASRNIGNDTKVVLGLQLDSSSTLNIDFRAKQNRNKNKAEIANQSLGDNNLLLSTNTQANVGSGSADIYNGNINYSKMFKKKGRTLTIDVQPESKKGTGTQNNLNSTGYYDTNGTLIRTDILNIRKDDIGSQTSIGGRISYTEPLNPYFSLQTGYSFKAINSSSFKQTYDNNLITGGQAQRVDSLSNDFKYNSFTNIGNAIIQYKNQSLTVSTGMEVTQTNFALKDLDRAKTFDRSYVNIAPTTNVSLKFDSHSNLTLQYKGTSTQPGIDQLQPVREIDNPLYQIVGNPDLKPSFSNGFGLVYNSANLQGTYFSIQSNYSFVNNAIISKQTIDEFNKRTTSFTNVNGQNNFGLSTNYGDFIKQIHFNYSLGLGYNRSTNITMINDVLNRNTNNRYSFNGTLRYSVNGAYLSTSSFLNLTDGTSSLGTLNNGRSFNHNHQISGYIRLPYKMEFNTSAVLYFQPANAGFESLNTYQWNTSLGIKLLKNESLELKLSVNDILNQQTGYNRTVSGNAISETTYSYIPRFILLGLRWNMSGNFLTKDKSK